MKQVVSVLLSLIPLGSMLFPSQQATIPVSKAAIGVSGTKLRLGMTKAQVEEKLSGQQVVKVKPDNWMVGTGGDTLQFKNGVLSFVSRYWVTYDNDIGEALFGAVSSINSEGFSKCVVTADTVSDPSMMTERVWMDCGEKSIVVVRSSINGKRHNMVYEHLGKSSEDQD